MGVEETAVAPRAGANDADLLESCEATFGIDIEDDEAGEVRTVGDLYDVIRWKCRTERLGASACAISDAYRNLRDHLTVRDLGTGIRPTTALPTVFGTDPRKEWALLRQMTGRKLPRLELSEGETTLMSMLIAVGLSAGVFGGLYVSDAFKNPTLGALVGLGLFLGASALVLLYDFLFSRTIPGELRTVADLARAVASSGVPVWTRPLSHKPEALWKALEEVVRRDQGIDGPVTKDLSVKCTRRRRRH